MFVFCFFSIPPVCDWLAASLSRCTERCARFLKRGAVSVRAIRHNWQFATPRHQCKMDGWLEGKPVRFSCRSWRTSLFVQQSARLMLFKRLLSKVVVVVVVVPVVDSSARLEWRPARVQG